MSHTPSNAITTDSIINRDATSARALAALAGSCFMKERLTHEHPGLHNLAPVLITFTSPQTLQSTA